MNWRNWHSAALLLLTLLGSQSSVALDVSVAGFAFAGSFQSAQERLPHLYKLNNREVDPGVGAVSYSRLLGERLRNVSNAHYSFNTDGDLVNLKGNDQVLMAVMTVNTETVATYQFDTYYKTFIFIRGDALIFDYKSQTLIRSYPVSVALFDATPEVPTEEAIDKLIDDLVRRDDENGLITQAVTKFANAAPLGDGVRTVQVRSAQVADEAMSLIPQNFTKYPGAVESMLADEFSSILSGQLGVAILPSSIGHAVGGVMSMQLENLGDYQMKVGEGDYLFDVRLEKFAKIKASESEAGTAYVYGAYMNIKFYEPALNTIYFESDIKNGETAIIPAGQISQEDFPAYQDAIRGVFSKLTDALKEPGSDWIKTASSNPKIENQLTLARKILKECI